MAAKPKSVFKSAIFRPVDGGQLFTAYSAELAGPANYVTKQDWRRDMDVEVRREGHEPFKPVRFDGTVSYTSGYPETTSPITLVHMARRPNGDVALVVGTDTTLYRFRGSDDERYSNQDSDSPLASDYFKNDNGDYVPPAYQTNWITIGSGFTSAANGAKRWQAVNLNGYAVFNNGVDLPVTYRVEDSVTIPIYELREAGVASVGCISSYNGILMLGDITEIVALDNWKATPTPYETVTSATRRNHARLIWSQINYPRKFAASNKGNTTAESTILVMDHAVKSYNTGDQITVIGAGINGGNLTSTITSVSGTTVFLADRASTTATSAIVSQTAEASSIVGYEDIEDDGSGIINMAPLQNSLIIYKDTSIFVAEYTGKITAPFRFRLIKIPDSKSLYYKNTLIAVKESMHIYAGRDNFYAFDLSARGPRELTSGRAVKDLLYGVADITKTDDVFAADNALTNEIWFGLPSHEGKDKVICFDYLLNTVSTTATDISSAASIKKPPSEDQNWFIMGNRNGVVLRYGLTNETQSLWSDEKAIYYREGEANPYDGVKSEYTSTIKSGLSDFGDSYNEKDMRAYVVQLASQQENEQENGEDGPTLDVKLYGYENPYDESTTLTGATPYQITKPKGQNLIPVFFRQHLFQDEIAVSGTTNVRLAGRIFDVSKIKSSSEVRTPAIT